MSAPLYFPKQTPFHEREKYSFSKKRIYFDYLAIRSHKLLSTEKAVFPRRGTNVGEVAPLFTNGEAQPKNEVGEREWPKFQYSSNLRKITFMC